MDIDKDFSRNVWCLLGLPFDAIDLNQTTAMIQLAVTSKSRCFLSTPNLNFLCAAQSDQAFRESVINSDLSIADGFPIVVIAKLLGIPLPERVAGSDLIEQLDQIKTDKPIKVFFFGGAPGAGELACNAINQQPSGLQAVGNYGPGFGSVAEMGSPEVIDTINRHKADFLIVALGAQKGQAWIEANRHRLNAHVISHLGAVINFFAGSVKRAPVIIRRLGCEWLWRIYQEPSLWRRYFNDGLSLFKLLVFNIFPYWLWLKCKRDNAAEQPLSVKQTKTDVLTQLTLSGNCTKLHHEPLTGAFKKAALAKRDTVLDLAHVSEIDSAFLGLCLVLYKHLTASGHTLKLINPNKDVKRIINWQKAANLLA